MKAKKGYIVPIVIVSLLVLFFLVYFAVFARFTVVQDAAWNYTMPKFYYLQLRWSLFKSGNRLKVVTINQDGIVDEQMIMQQLGKLDTGGTVLLSPTVTAAITYLNIDIKESLVRTTVIGIGKDNRFDYFDTVLVSNPFDGWTSAVKQGVKPGEKAAIIFDDSSSAEARIIFESFNSDNLSKYNRDDYGKLFVTEIQKALDEEGVSLIYCPWVNDMIEFMDTTNRQWITDYRYSAVVPKELRRGVVYPDIYNSVKSLLSLKAYESLQNTNELTYAYKNFR